MMKAKLTILSLSPLFLLTIISNAHLIDVTKIALTNIILFLCLLWLLASLYIFFLFRFMVSFGTEGSFTIKDIREDNEASINFFMTFVLSLVVGDLNQWQSVTKFIIIFSVIFILLMKTDLFYANPILSILGYHIYKIIFKNNPDFPEECIIIAPRKIDATDTVEYMVISNHVLFAKAIKRRRISE